MSEVKSKRSPQKRAFTLVELLIVVIIIGVLAGMMMLSAEPAISSAKATRIVADLRSMKAAAMLYKADKGSWPLWFYTGGSYKSMPTGSPGPGNYSDLKTEGDGYWVGAMYDPNVAFSVAYLINVSTGVKKCIEKQAEKTGLYGDNFTGMPYHPDMNTIQKFDAERHNMLLSVINK